MLGDLHEDRLEAVYRQLVLADAKSVLDLGCGSGPLFARLASDPRFLRLVGVDVDDAALQSLRERLGYPHRTDGERLKLLQGSFTDVAPELTGFDAAVLVETIEHVALSMLPLMERAVFGTHRPGLVIVTTPNVEFNDLLGVPRHRFRHPGHRFEWTRREFRQWSVGVGRRNGYEAGFHDVGGSHPRLGGPTQMAVFRRA